MSKELIYPERGSILKTKVLDEPSQLKRGDGETDEVFEARTARYAKHFEKYGHVEIDVELIERDDIFRWNSERIAVLDEVRAADGKWSIDQALRWRAIHKKVTAACVRQIRGLGPCPADPDGIVERADRADMLIDIGSLALDVQRPEEAQRIFLGSL
jgi:hypothetical protein